MASALTNHIDQLQHMNHQNLSRVQPSPNQKQKAFFSGKSYFTCDMTINAYRTMWQGGLSGLFRVSPTFTHSSHNWMTDLSVRYGLGHTLYTTPPLRSDCFLYTSAIHLSACVPQEQQPLSNMVSPGDPGLTYGYLLPTFLFCSNSKYPGGNHTSTRLCIASTASNPAILPTQMYFVDRKISRYHSRPAGMGNQATYLYAPCKPIAYLSPGYTRTFILYTYMYAGSLHSLSGRRCLRNWSRSPHPWLVDWLVSSLLLYLSCPLIVVIVTTYFQFIEAVFYARAYIFTLPPPNYLVLNYPAAYLVENNFYKIRMPHGLIVLPPLGLLHCTLIYMVLLIPYHTLIPETLLVDLHRPRLTAPPVPPLTYPMYISTQVLSIWCICRTCLGTYCVHDA